MLTVLLPKRFDWRPWALVAPALIVLMAVTAIPFARTIWLAFHDDPHGFMQAQPGWSLTNFRVLLQDRAWWTAVSTTLLFAAGAVISETCAGLAIAILLQGYSLKLRGILLAVILLPWAVPSVVAARLWNWMLNDQYGIINAMLVRLGLLHQGVAWTTHPRSMVAVMIAIDFWQATPFMALLSLAGLQSIPTDVFEAAKLDGASPWQRFISITLPLVAPVLSIAVLFRLLDALRMFDLASVLYGTDMSGMTLSAFVQSQIVQFGAPGYGAASALGTLGIIALAASLYGVCLKIPGWIRSS
ncbi:carbohydrate ABC transporter permease [Gluconobacter oxydans]|uniref:Putative sugar ABC transporter permease protein n=1 Tax=Gluconobacter oxydans DSM 3504 TaxID=1288313 RepID=A0A067Z4H3_GLUOY|nr:sugar ABC transporter permease [Gluconobacter oxydans]AHK71169.1 putative sugar ABC transporter permease protein [Gluconobacter oxydans DSM 3504]